MRPSFILDRNSGVTLQDQNRKGVIEPTLLTGVTAAMDVAQEETFGPLAPVFRFTDEADVVRQANDTASGLRLISTLAISRASGGSRRRSNMGLSASTPA
jgi:acyl-CoA reductase-like NAD-dependent aldehyde dehydrogenase